MADQAIQDHRPPIRENGKSQKSTPNFPQEEIKPTTSQLTANRNTNIVAAKGNKNNTTILTTYRKLAFSFPVSPAHEKKDIKPSESSKYELKKSTKIKAISTKDVALSKKPSGWKWLVQLWTKSLIKRLHPVVGPQISARMSIKESVDFNRGPIKSTWTAFTLAQLKTATNNFSQENLIGKGGYAQVYRGCLANGQLVAIKRINKGIADEDIFNFLCEIGIIAHVNHPNTAKMIGYGVQGGAFLVLHLSPLGSLASILHDSKEKLDWRKRHKIIVGITEGLHYLHENCERRIIHRDIKADNILLSEDYEPQICDFGLSKWLPKQWSHRNATKFEGTFGYFAPEYFMLGIVDEKIDIFSFGVLLLELVTGRKAIDKSRKSLVLWAQPLLDSNAVKELVDPSLGDEYDEEEMRRVISIATACIKENPVRRPRMTQVVALLRGACDVNLNGFNEKRRHLR